MIYRILSVGWSLRIFVVLLWLVAMLERCLLPLDDISVFATIIIFANAFLYLTVSKRLVALLSHSSMSKLLPQLLYSSKTIGVSNIWCECTADVNVVA
jgi:hypothetical protein